jgi:hypothetical protein
MSITSNESFGVLHGLIFGALFLLAFSSGFFALYSLRGEWLTTEGLAERVSRIRLWMWGMAIVAWLTVLSGTYIVYPWYRAKPPTGTTDLSNYPRSFLLADPNLAGWHNFGMEWKEHIAWLVPIAATIVAFIVMKYGANLAKQPRIRSAAMWFLVIAFVAAGIAGVLGAFITKAAPVH